MEKDRIKMFNDILGATTNAKDSYYVYALYENNNTMPFYIGKGCGERVLSHQKESQEFLKSLQDESLDGQEENKKLSRKVETILSNNSKIKQVIVKFGLTSDEAFQVESALINLFNFSFDLKGDDKLTNIVSGHATRLERETVSRDGMIKAREIDSFIDNYFLPEFNFDDIEEKCVFIKINTTFTSESTIDDIYEHTRGIWNIAKWRRKDLEYAIGLYRGVCVGVFKIKDWVKGADWSQAYPFPIRENKDEQTIVKYSDIKMLEKDHPELYKEYFLESAGKDKSEEALNTKLTNWRNRHYFYGPYDDQDIPAHLREAMNKRINYTPKSLTSQSACIFNF